MVKSNVLQLIFFSCGNRQNLHVSKLKISFASASKLKSFVLFREDAAKLKDDLISPMRDFHFKE